MLKNILGICLAAAIAASPTVVVAASGTSSSWGSYGSGPTVPTISLTPRDRSWNFDNEAQNRAIAGAEWIREHGGAGQHPLFPFQ